MDFSKQVGTIKPLHGVGQAPFTMTDYSVITYLKEAGVPYSRLHDVGGDRYQRKNQVLVENETKGGYVVAAMGESGYLVIVNETAKSVPLTLTMDQKIIQCRLVADNSNMEPCESPDYLAPCSILCVQTD